MTLITAAIIIVQLIEFGTFELSQLFSLFMGSMVLATIIGIVFTLIWVEVLWKLYKGEELAYVFTLGVLFILYSVAELIGGNGAISVLVLTLSLGNLPLILETFKQKVPLDSGVQKKIEGSIGSLQKRFNVILEKIRKSQVDFGFFIQNFFFVYIGIIFDPVKTTPLIFGICVAIIALMFVSRYVSARIVGLSDPDFKRNSTFIASMVARGFTATFVALLPATKGIEIPSLKEIVLIMVLLSTTISIVGCIYHEQKIKKTQNNLRF